MKKGSQYHLALCGLCFLVGYTDLTEYCRANDGPKVTVEFPVALMPKQFTYTYGKHIIVKDGDANYEKLKQFMIKEQRGWTNIAENWTIETNVLANKHNYESSTMTIRCDDTVGLQVYTSKQIEYFAFVDYMDKNGNWVNLSKTMSSSCPLPSKQ